MLKPQCVGEMQELTELTFPLWLRPEGTNRCGRCVTLSLGDGALMNVCLLPVTSIQGTRSALENLLWLLMAATSPFCSRSSRICCIQMVPDGPETDRRTDRQRDRQSEQTDRPHFQPPDSCPSVLYNSSN